MKHRTNMQVKGQKAIDNYKMLANLIHHHEDTINTILEMIIHGEFDDKKNDGKILSTMPDFETFKQAKEKCRQLGYSHVSKLVNEILRNDYEKVAKHIIHRKYQSKG